MSLVRGQQGSLPVVLLVTLVLALALTMQATAPGQADFLSKWNYLVHSIEGGILV